MNTPCLCACGRIRLGRTISVCFAVLLSLLLLPDSKAGATCRIEGPGWVRLGDEFRLCGPGGSEGATWEWEGVGITSGKDGRCADVLAMTTGPQSYTLRITEDGVTSNCSFEVHMGGEEPAPEDCGVRGPATAEVGETFTLCGPEKDGLFYTWTGKAVPRGSYGRCVKIRTSEPGDLVIVLAVEDGSETRRCEHLVRVRSTALGACGIEGPKAVREGDAFELCAPEREGFFYTWAGPGIASGTYTRCLTLPGRSAGTYEFTLTLDGGGRSSTCLHSIRVQAAEPEKILDPVPAPAGANPAPNGISAAPDLPRPEARDSSATGPEATDDPVPGQRGGDDPPAGNAGGKCPRPLSYWQGFVAPGGDGDAETRETLDRIAACVDERGATRGFLRMLQIDGEWDPRERARRELAVLIANVCAARLGVRDEKDQPVGIDPFAELTCRAGNATNVGELIALAEATLGRRTSARAADAPSAERLGRCLERVNRGLGTSPGCDHGETPGEVKAANPARRGPVARARAAAP